MPSFLQDQQVPVHKIEPDATGNQHFRVYQFEGATPSWSEVLIPHRKDHYLIVFIRRAGGHRQWIDTTAYTLKDNTVYFMGPEHIIVKEELKQLWSTGIAFTPEFLSLDHNGSLKQLPIILNPQGGHELLLTEHDVTFIEDILAKISTEHHRPGDWQQRMLSAQLILLLTYLSRLYTEQYHTDGPSAEKIFLKKYQAEIDKNFKQLHEVNDYAGILNISPGHLSDVVKLQSGKPAIKHIHARLIMEARRLLFHTARPLKEIAFDLGFSDTSYFSRFFKRETGVSPADYRANIRKMYH
ncbi:helix-turn-helix domain-containing protein [Mucilaginibacter myungsuensis]|uniref:AraC family transcriptional regulator n=1 Tax=Mucilaginibacter myungsuensis TaxID=649104 RepID=A0A929PXA9_9SPHI|nr:helix-turn-helix domain-containing protein [Mucilaginibacter myungsuensis]MBE9662210.1 AraC family transcriptional regulator [Mucilaginibacter myungsuensis]MDN3599356.1 helix-turn-helix domain-containing protein [Mucilaginibacter myungsuensis]